ncbi:DUF3667 domain-containing protein [Hellea sp.]|nr:DUF3667 domain-containing protein [Hellea sp.]
MGETEPVDLDGAGLLDEDSIPNSNQSLDCFSCGESMNGVYCYACGNKNDNYRRSIWSLGAELFSSLTAFESRIWQSLKSLIFKPGQMAREFSDGARQKWTSPIRFYLMSSLLLFGYVALTQTQLIAFGTMIKDSSAISPVKVGLGDSELAPQVFFLKRKSTINKSVSEDAISIFEKEIADIMSDDDEKSKEGLERELSRTRASLKSLEEQISGTDNSYAKEGISRARDPMLTQIKALEERIANFDADAAEAANDSDEEKPKSETDTGSNINIVGASGQKMTLDNDGIRQSVLIGMRHPERINAPISKYLPRIMFFMMPFSMLMGAIFIRDRKKAMLYDHLVHAAYIHAFSFLLLFVFIILVQITPIKGLMWIYTLILLIYLPLSAKRMFGRGWFKTVLTSYGVGLIYTFIMMLILILLIAMGVSDILKGVALPS